jgi:hypothetical protein
MTPLRSIAKVCVRRLRSARTKITGSETIMLTASPTQRRRKAPGTRSLTSKPVNASVPTYRADCSAEPSAAMARNAR